ncbi:MAG: glucose 1-dehydrogenase [Actinomycetota bacterium]|nr:glucose 1-dehydrogenase [Actinomycetota bacterium]MDD5667568.1 glucose 1-dehydrogenase [Actinomycetota bacterium]
MRLQDKVAVITGGGSGVGRAASLLFAAEGAKVVVVDYQGVYGKAVGQEVADEVKAAGGEALYVETDLAVEEQVADMVCGTVEAYGKVDILFNNASHGFSSPLTMTTLLDTPEKDWNEVIRNNLNSLFFCTKYCQPEMVKAGGGSIINTASSNALVAVPGADAYTAAKGGVVALTRIMAITYAPDIRVNCICPGTVRTPMIADMLAMLEDYLKQNIPLQRVAEPEEIARVALFLASGEASYITGAIIPVDGGWTTM